MTSKVFVELERIRRKCKVEELFLKSLFKKRGRRKITQHNHTHNITAIYTHQEKHVKSWFNRPKHGLTYPMDTTVFLLLSNKNI